MDLRFNVVSVNEFAFPARLDLEKMDMQRNSYLSMVVQSPVQGQPEKSRKLAKKSLTAATNIIRKWKALTTTKLKSGVFPKRSEEVVCMSDDATPQEFFADMQMATQSMPKEGNLKKRQQKHDQLIKLQQSARHADSIVTATRLM